MSEHPWLGYFVLNDAGDPMPERDLLVWGRWLETADVHLKEDWLGDIRVSTVFLGLDYDHLGMIAVCNNEMDPLSYQPILWETVVFDSGDPIEQSRYRSKEEALEGHQRLVEKYATTPRPLEHA